MTISGAHQKLAKKKISAVELTQFYLAKIHQKDKDLNAFITVSEDLALAQAQEIDRRIADGEKIGWLAGIPCAIKDNILVKNVRCTAGSKMLENYIAPYEATVVKRLRQAGVVFIGKTNLDEFAMGSSTENSYFGPCKNPCDTCRVPGGSSGGSAAAVAADLAIFALGSDTGGSVRQPASFCGVVGLKPTYGRVSRFGLIAMASSLDQIGPLTQTAKDAEIVFQAISGPDPLDATSLKYQIPNTKYDIGKLKIGLPKEYFGKGLDKKVKAQIEKAIQKFEKLGIVFQKVSLPHTPYALASYYIIMPSEVSSNLARYDGIKYGFQAQGRDLGEIYFNTRAQGFGVEARRRIILGTFCLSSGYFEAFYLRAQKVRGLIKKDFEKAFKKVDLLLTPTCPTPAFKLGEKITSPLAMYLSDVYTVSANLAGLPAISVPCGQVKNLPVSFQLMGPQQSEGLLLKIAQTYETNFS